ncbi:BON domain-containing protein [Bordetella sp. FB-8]|uniref:BON domain-containing protein n=1 Tax=Bordetella sp. FB-8 TaxID=1159870 RepID=UPI00035FC21C|nr:BON domain-containing protein [Bordetella sp. FB-8]
MRNAFPTSGITINDDSGFVPGGAGAMRRKAVVDVLPILRPFRLAVFACGMALALSCALSARMAVAQQSTPQAQSENDQGAVDQTEHVASDSWITTKVKSELLADSVSKGFDVGVETTHGVVALSGKLANSGAIDHVKQIAQSVQGVKSVDTSALRVGTP